MTEKPDITLREIPLSQRRDMKYQMLVLSTTITKLECENDAEALAIFRKNSKSRELRAEPTPAIFNGVPEYPLGRLLAYKDAAGTEHLANIVHIPQAQP